MSPERLQEGLQWSWQQSYSWRSFFVRLTGAPWSILPLWLSTNFGYRYFAEKLPSKADGVYRDPAVQPLGEFESSFVEELPVAASAASR
jgi:hypothetical protein